MIRRDYRALCMGIALALCLQVFPAMAQVRVAFIEPQRFTDAENRFGSGPSLDVTLAEMRRILEQYGTRILRPGENLSIDVLDIDLAGMDQLSGAMPYGIRVVQDVTPPRFRLRYTLKERGRTLLAATETVSDINFLSRSARLASGGSFYHERELLRDWFQARFVTRRPPPG